jgi:hypothetical protein
MSFYLDRIYYFNDILIIFNQRRLFAFFARNVMNKNRDFSRNAFSNVNVNLKKVLEDKMTIKYMFPVYIKLDFFVSQNQFRRMIEEKLAISNSSE